MNKFLIIFTIIFCNHMVGDAQNIIQADTGNVTIYADSRLPILIQKQQQVNALAMRYHPGYRVQVVTTGDREKANDIRAEMLQQFPKYRSYLQYHAPYFRVRVGDFLTQQDADSLRQQIIQMIPSGVFVVPDQINMNALSDKVNPDDSTN